jgi:hypothetical protein
MFFSTISLMGQQWKFVIVAGGDMNAISHDKNKTTQGDNENTRQKDFENESHIIGHRHETIPACYCDGSRCMWFLGKDIRPGHIQLPI